MGSGKLLFIKLNQMTKFFIFLLMLTSIFDTINARPLLNKDGKFKVFSTLRDGEIKHLINNEFGNICISPSKFNLGNFAALKIDEEQSQAEFGGNIFFKKSSSILNIKASGGYFENVFSIFSNNKLSSQVNIGLQYNYMIRARKKPSFDSRKVLEYVKMRNKIEEDEIFSIHKLESDYPMKQLNLELSKQRQVIEALNITHDSIQLQKYYANPLNIISLRDSITSLNIKITLTTDIQKREKLMLEKGKFELALRSAINNEAALDMGIASFDMTVDSVEFLITRINFEIEKLQAERDRLSGIPFEIELERERFVDKKTALINDSLTKILKPKIITIKWFSVGLEAENHNFTLFDNLQSYTNHKKSIDTSLYGFNIQFSIYHLSLFRNRAYLFNTGISYNLEDNLSSLSKTELVERKNYGPNPDDRYQLDKTVVYIGNYKSQLHTYKVYSNFYWFLFGRDVGAIHFYPELKFRKDQKFTFNLGTGLLFSFKDSKDEKNIINTEIYLLSNDVFNLNMSGEKYLERSEIGIQFTFPISFKSQNYERTED